MSTTVSKLWPHAKRILLPYEGMASQLYVLDLPHADLDSTIRTFSESVSNPVVVTVDGYTDEEPKPLNPELRIAILERSVKTTSHQIRGLHPDCQNLALFLWVGEQSYDAELVFWGDLAFPEPADDTLCEKTFQSIVDLSEQLRARSPRSECVLALSEVGDPRESRDEPSTFWW